MANQSVVEHANTSVAPQANKDMVIKLLMDTIYPGASRQSAELAFNYCSTLGLDVMQKPVHIMPMSVKNKQTNQYEQREVILPGIGLYRIQATRSGNYLGMTEPEFGPLITMDLSGVEVKFPEWCKLTVKKLVNGMVAEFTAKEYWLENYATKGRDTLVPNDMWRKRAYGQIAKCTEAQCLRKGWPETCNLVTAEEVEGKEYLVEGEVIQQSSPAQQKPRNTTEVAKQRAAEKPTLTDAQIAEREELMKDLAEVVKKGGIEAFKKVWSKDMSKEQRELVGVEAKDKFKADAEAISANAASNEKPVEGEVVNE